MCLFLSFLFFLIFLSSSYKVCCQVYVFLLVSLFPYFLSIDLFGAGGMIVVGA